MVTGLEVGRNHKAGKLYNRSLILRLILNRGPVSRLTLSRLTQLSPAALTILTGTLIAEGLLIELEGEEDVDSEPGRAGRRSTPLDLNPTAGRTLGVHITPRLVRVGLVSLKGGLLDQERLGPADRHPQITLKLITQAAQEIINRNGLTNQQVLGMGVGAVGLVDAKRGVNLRALSVGWQDVPLKAELEKTLGIAVYADNNVRGMALAESLFGHGRSRKFSNIAVVYVGAGVGCGIIAEGEIYRGSGWAAGEIGHTIVDPHGQTCYCGAQGCLETVASEAAMLEAARQEVRQNSSGLLAKLAQGDSSQTSIEHLLITAQDGDKAATGIIERAGEGMGIAVVNLVKALSPDTVIFAGRVTREAKGFVPKVEEVLRRSSAPPGPELTVLTSSLDDNIGLIGAAALALQEFLYSQPSGVRG